MTDTYLSMQRDSQGNILYDDNSKKLLSPNAIAVSSSSPAINTSTSPYSGLSTGNSPFTILPQSIEIPGYEAVKSQELSERNIGSSTITFNPADNPINSLSDWTALFPEPGTVDALRVVNVTQGLNIPDGVSLDNYVITVNGTINFNGTSSLNNTVLIVSGGGINLGDNQFHNSAIFAPGNINMNQGVRFSGNSLLASEGDINFNGATLTTNMDDRVRVVSQNTIHYNAALDTIGQFLSVQNIMFNGNTTLFGSLKAQNSITCNSYCSIRMAANSVSSPPTTPPVDLFPD
ncbi:MAG: hypothetical protein AAFQ41_15185 [Cyanobacteria bacterium J06623_7]